MRSSNSLIVAAASYIFAASFASAQQQCNGLTNAAKDACDMQAAFGGSTVYPDVISTFNPSGALYVKYGTTAIGGAQQLSPSKVSSEPTVSYTAVNGSTSGESYLLTLVDPDGSDPDTLHWLSYGLSVGSDGTLSGGTDAAAYGGPNPPQGNGTHRYVFLLYQQPSGFSLPSSANNLPSTVSGGRLGWSLTSFVSAAKLGDPVGGSFFKSVYDGVAIPSASATASSASSTSAASGSSRASSSHTSSRASSSSDSGSSATGSASGSAASASSSSTSSTTSGAKSVKVAGSVVALVAGAAIAALA